MINMDNNVTIEPEYVYLTIPSKYVCVYHKLLVFMADFGKRIIDDCNATCKGEGKNIIKCWNLFQSAVACYSLGKTEEADFLIKYITYQLDSIYKGTGDITFNESFPINIDEQGHLKAIVTCNSENNPIFTVDVETGKLYQELKENTKNEYNIIDNNLIVKKQEDL